MGDLGVEGEPYGNKQAISSQPMSHQDFGGLKDQGHSYSSLGQSKSGHCDGSYSETEKVISTVPCFILIYASLTLTAYLHVSENQKLFISFKM
jgi:hypothetical protein